MTFHDNLMTITSPEINHEAVYQCVDAIIAVFCKLSTLALPGQSAVLFVLATICNQLQTAPRQSGSVLEGFAVIAFALSRFAVKGGNSNNHKGQNTPSQKCGERNILSNSIMQSPYIYIYSKNMADGPCRLSHPCPCCRVFDVFGVLVALHHKVPKVKTYQISNIIKPGH